MLYLVIEHHNPDIDDGLDPYSVLIAAFEDDDEAYEYADGLSDNYPYRYNRVEYYRDGDMDSDLHQIAYELDLEIDLDEDRMHLYGYYNDDEDIDDEDEDF